MRILLSIKAILNYLYNHLIDLIWTKKIRFADGSEMTTASSGGFSLYDIKVMSQAIAEKGFAFMCHTNRRDLPKSLVPTLYNDIYQKFSACDITFGVENYYSSTYGIQVVYQNYQYFMFDDFVIRRSQYGDLSSPEDICDLTEELTITGWSGIPFFKKVNNGWIVIYPYLDDENSKNRIWLAYYNDNWELNYKTEIRYDYHIYGIKFYYYDTNSDRIFLIFNDGKLYIINVATGNYTTQNATVNDDDYNDNGSIFLVGNLLVYLIKNGYDEPYIVRHNIDNGQETFAYINSAYGWWQQASLYYDYDTQELLCFTNGDGNGNYGLCCRVSLDLGTNWTENYIGGFTTARENIGNVVKSGNDYYLDDSSDLVKFNKTDRFTQVKATGFGGQLGYVFPYIQRLFIFENNITLSNGGSNDNLIYKTDRINIRTQKTVYTDSYTINGNTVNIDYYKCNDFKICISDGGTNDTNLETVFNENGWLPYFVLDLANETVCIQRDFHTYSSMYIGDNFLDDFDDMPSSSDYTGLAFYGEMIEYVDTKISQIPSTKCCITNYALNHLTSRTKDNVYHPTEDTLIIIGRTSFNDDFSWSLQVSRDNSNWITILDHTISSGDPGNAVLQYAIIEKGLYYKATGSGIQVYNSAPLRA